MSTKNTAALYLALPLLIAVPVLRADSIRAPADWNFDGGSLRTVSVSTVTQISANTWAAPTDEGDVISTFTLRRHRDHHWDADDPSPVPEPRALAPLLLFAAVFLYYRKRLLAAPLNC